MLKLIILSFLLILLLALISKIFNTFEEYRLKGLRNDPKLKELKRVFDGFFNQERYWEKPLDMLNNRRISEEVNLYKGDKSYTINKENIFLCLKDENKKYYENNLLIYVLAHEYAHTLSKSIGHTEEFHNIFEALLVELADSNIYNPNLKIDPSYCLHG